MKLKNVSCTQFAGVRDIDISFDSGINIIYGKNESGKSTVVNLISRTLFQGAKLDGRRDKNFIERYFPSEKKDGIKGDFADGKVTFFTDKGEFTILKEWGAEPVGKLFSSEGVIRDHQNINSLLKEILGYGEGVYGDILLSSQHNAEASLQTILDASKNSDGKQEIAAAVSKAFSESDGITMEAVGQAINARLEEILGKHWNLETDRPERKNGRWTKELGELLKAYYALEDAEIRLNRVVELEKAVDDATKNFEVAHKRAEKAEKEFKSFNTFASQLTMKNHHVKTITSLNQELQKVSNIQGQWPKLIEELSEAKALKSERENRNLLDKYQDARRLKEELEILKKKLAEIKAPTEQEISTVKLAQKQISIFENKLCGMNLNAVINMLGEHLVEVKVLRSGEYLDIEDKNLNITEAVNIVIPGVMEMQLAPANVDVKEIKNQIVQHKDTVVDVFDRYDVGTVEELEELAKTVRDLQSRINYTQERLEMSLGDTAYEKLEAFVGDINKDVRVLEDIDNDITVFCKVNEITGYIASRETIIEGYKAEYENQVALKEKICSIEKELQMALSELKAMENIPAKYQSVSEPEKHLAMLQDELKIMQIEREKALTNKTIAIGNLESYKNNMVEEPVIERENALRLFEEQQALLKHWIHIKEIFEKQRTNVENNPMKDIADSFTKYLGLISKGRISSEFPDEDKLDMNIYSNNSLLDYNKMSEGTRETVSLAFRLAVLDHLFPDGGGVIILDDPFNDMDRERMEKSSRLIKECATRHQVIFLTCKEEYLDMLEGNKLVL